MIRTEELEARHPLIPDQPQSGDQTHTRGIDGGSMQAMLEAASGVQRQAPTEITSRTEETRGRLVSVADLERKQLSGYGEPQLVERERPLYPVHVIGNWVRNQFGMVRIISTAPRDVSKMYPDKDMEEMAKTAGWAD